ncbi:hypothetical protein B0H16DRAFT_648483 [Mycena metata]|uniref:Uncharacterized protein n=1 Tax=Mycena metata TaxID=1033252 RepID=A0AAD7H0D3_9AGAR|nr:hypothetical protein B0H16DRAFT_648483 [Mycena metata]
MFSSDGSLHLYCLLFIVMMTVFHAVHTSVLTLASPTTTDWILTMASFVKDNKEPLHEKVNAITAPMAAIVGEMKHRNIIPRLNLPHLPWKFSDKEATFFATKLSESIEANLM